MAMKKSIIFLLAMVVLLFVFTSEEVLAEDYIYWANYNGTKIGRANIDGSNPIYDFITGCSSPGGVAVDSTYIYWTNYDSGIIGRAPLDGSNSQDFITGCDGPMGVAVDSTYIYWTNYNSHSIGRAPLDGSNPPIYNFITGCDGPTGVAVDSNFIFWANNGSTSIGAANIDGSDKTQNFIMGCSSPGGVAVDSTYIYWTNYSEEESINSIGRATIYGGDDDANQNFIMGCASPRGVAVDSNFIYWSNYNAGSGNLGRAKIDGSSVEQEFVTGCNDLWGITSTTGPTLVILVDFHASIVTDSVRIAWKTASEINSAGYNIWRSCAKTDPYDQINDSLIPAKGSPTQGASYEFIDSNVEPGKTYYYKLEDIDTSGSRFFYGPVSATVPASIPTITDFNPKRGAPGMKVVITGTNFTGTTVKFGGTDADSFTVDSETQITAVVGYGATGKVTVTTNGGTATSAVDFTYDPAAIPTLNEWAMILFALIILSSTVVVLRKRRFNGDS